VKRPVPGRTEFSTAGCFDRPAFFITVQPCMLYCFFSKDNGKITEKEGNKSIAVNYT
jgi:hypothetical protein